MTAGRHGQKRKSRELALQMLFQKDLSGNEPRAITETFEELQKSPIGIRLFAVRMFEGTLEHLDEIDAMIVKQAENWRIERMAVVDRNIMRMAIWEFLYEQDTPKLVIIDEALEIAKKFGNEKSSQFINGVLDGILRRYNLRDAEQPRGGSAPPG